MGSGQSAVIYARDGIATKVYREGQPKKQVYQEAFTLAVVKDCGIPVPEIYCVETFHGRTAVLMDQVRGDSLADLMLKYPEQTEEYMDKIVSLQKDMHDIRTTEFRPLKLVLFGTILASTGITEDEKKRLSSMLETLPDDLSICHGDFHGGNVIFDGKSYIIIDWAEVACGAPAADACRSYMDIFIMDEDIAEMYLDKYCTATGRSREEILAWLPVTAGSLYGYIGEDVQKKIGEFFKA
ncbi:phosphotransferase family protein [Methanolacinia petrolearia]|uniref:phosphotransferase family protein n=1 Tax=Methanolacinia petrolearia TaxID=54120 RepID=UPI003BAA4DFB